MAHHKSAIKRIRRNNRANVQNSQYLAGVRTAVKKFRAAVTGTAEVAVDKAKIPALLTAAQSLLAKAAQKGLIHKNTAKRKIGRLAHLMQNADKVQAAAAPVAAKKSTAKKAAPAAPKAAAAPAAPKAAPAAAKPKAAPKAAPKKK